MGCTVLEFLLAADPLTASQLRSEGIPLVIFDLLNLIVYPNLYKRIGAHIAKAVISDLSFTDGAGDAGGILPGLVIVNRRSTYYAFIYPTTRMSPKPS
jgi:hypothetical protein